MNGAQLKAAVRVIFAISLISLTTKLHADDDTFVIGIKSTAPFVNSELPINTNVSIKDNPKIKPTGFLIDVTDNVLERVNNNKEIVYRRYPHMTALMEGVSKGEVDMGVGAATISAKREKFVDFSQPYYMADIGILVNKQESSFFSASTFLSWESVKILGYFIAYILIFAHIFWVSDKGESVSTKYPRGISESIWWTLVTMSTVGYGDYAPKRVRSRVIGCFVIFSGIIIFSIATAAIASMMTVTQLTSDINGPEDLRGRNVGMIKGAITETITSTMNVKQKSYDNLEVAMEALRKGKVDAVVHDRPVLQYLNKQAQEKSDLDEFCIVDRGFYPSMYGLAFPSDKDELREEIDIALLEFLEDSTHFKTLHKKWFGE